MKPSSYIKIAVLLLTLVSGKAFGFGTPPIFTSEPSNQVVPLGGTAVMDGSATHPIYINWYFWYLNGKAYNWSTNNGVIGQPVVTITNVQDSDAGAYNVSVNNDVGTVNSTNGYLNCLLLGSPWLQTDMSIDYTVGGGYNDANGGYVIFGAGANFSGTADKIHYVYQTLTGDGSIVARITSDDGAETNGFAGVIMRETTAAKSRYVAVCRQTNGKLVSKVRTSTGGGTTTTISTATLTMPDCWVKLTRTGSSFVSSYSSDGTAWTPFKTNAVTMASSATFGLVVTSGNVVNYASHNFGDADTAVFDNLTVVP
jgi:hypothetical protein